MLVGFLILFLMLMGCVPPWGRRADERLEAARGEIQRILDTTDGAEVLPVAGRSEEERERLRRFYRPRSYGLVWTDDSGFRGGPFLAALELARTHGLDPRSYRVEWLDPLLAKSRESALSAEELARLDLALSAAFFAYAADLDAGRARVSAARDLTPVLEHALAGNPGATLEALAPKHPAYARLRDALHAYREFAGSGEWPPIGGGDLAPVGERDRRAHLLRSRLARTGDLVDGSSVADPDAVDERLVAAVRAFQERHAIEPTGRIDDETLGALNVTAAERVPQIEANLERWRWLPDDLGPRVVLVNVPEFRLRVLEGGNEVLGMRVIVGRNYDPTPLLQASMTRLVFNPYWKIPPSITREEILPKMLKDPRYARRQGIDVVTTADGEWRPVGRGPVDWKRVGAPDSKLRLRQRPGPRNPLGRVKFMLPNPHDVYLHDTPQGELFARPDRQLSHGCIRVERPLELAEYALRSVPNWDRQAITRVMESGDEKLVRLVEPLPVVLVYFTAWVGRLDGRTHFRKDIYGWDADPTAAAAGARRP